jgi:hypothetical protein
VNPNPIFLKAIAINTDLPRSCHEVRHHRNFVHCRRHVAEIESYPERFPQIRQGRPKKETAGKKEDVCNHHQQTLSRRIRPSRLARLLVGIRPGQPAFPDCGRAHYPPSGLHITAL